MGKEKDSPFEIIPVAVVSDFQAMRANNWRAIANTAEDRLYDVEAAKRDTFGGPEAVAAVDLLSKLYKRVAIGATAFASEGRDFAVETAQADSVKDKSQKEQLLNISHAKALGGAMMVGELVLDLVNGAEGLFSLTRVEVQARKPTQELNKAEQMKHSRFIEAISSYQETVFESSAAKIQEMKAHHIELPRAETIINVIDELCLLSPMAARGESGRVNKVLKQQKDMLWNQLKMVVHTAHRMSTNEPERISKEPDGMKAWLRKICAPAGAEPR